MDRIFMLLNHTWSCIGESYLYCLLRMPAMEPETLQERNRLIEYFRSHKEEREKMEYRFARIGKTGSQSLFDYIYNLAELTPEPVWPELGLDLCSCCVFRQHFCQWQPLACFFFWR